MKVNKFYIILVTIVYIFMGFVMMYTGISIYTYLIVLSILMYFSYRISIFLEKKYRRNDVVETTDY